MDILHRSMFHLIYLTAIFLELMKLEQYDMESVAIIGGIACMSGVMAIELFFISNQSKFRNLMKNPNWKIVKTILLINNKPSKEI